MLWGAAKGAGRAPRVLILSSIGGFRSSFQYMHSNLLSDIACDLALSSSPPAFLAVWFFEFVNPTAAWAEVGLHTLYKLVISGCQCDRQMCLAACGERICGILQSYCSVWARPFVHPAVIVAYIVARGRAADVLSATVHLLLLLTRRDRTGAAR